MIRSSWNSVPFNVWLIGTLTKVPISFNFPKILKSKIFMSMMIQTVLFFAMQHDFSICWIWVFFWSLFYLTIDRKYFKSPKSQKCNSRNCLNRSQNCRKLAKIAKIASLRRFWKFQRGMFAPNLPMNISQPRHTE